MKLFVSLAALLIANNSFALTLPKAELNKLDGALASSLMQLSSEDACAGIKKDHDFFKEAESQIGASRAARFDSLQASTFAGTAVTGLLGLMATGGWQSAKRSYPGIAQPLLKRAKFMFSSSGALAISTGSLALFANSSVGTTPEHLPGTEIMLNQGKLEKFAKDTSREAAELFSLGMSDEATIRAEIKKAILQKSKDGDDSPFDFHEVLKKASYRGQPIFSGSKLKMLENLYNASIDNEELLELSPQKKLASLAAVNSLLDLCAKKQTAGNAWKKEAAGQISKNSKIIEAALEHIALTAPDSGGSTTLEAQ